MKSTAQPQKRSQRLTTEEQTALKEFLATFLTKKECAAAIGILSDVLTDTLIRGTAHPTTIEKIRIATGVTAQSISVPIS